jgi:hypothetical protein
MSKDQVGSENFVVFLAQAGMEDAVMVDFVASPSFVRDRGLLLYRYQRSHSSDF